ncbi:MAG: M48 family peptidase [Candidatus Chaera renei]|uniref:M48 family peptidase n=1 Tax=Candidatus Chaera renei TaxID=2506947 RepID=A0A4Q0AIR5_9BACT|nr:MAG: M48 family peptidase [Candidatus Chaera renei]
MPKIIDAEFGPVTVHRSPHARSVRLRIDHLGNLSACLPPRVPLSAVKLLLGSSRGRLRKMIAEARASSRPLSHGQAIGSSHRLEVRQTAAATPSCRVADLTVVIKLPAGWDVYGEPAQAFIRQGAKKALNKEARAHLPRRLAYLAKTGGFAYQQIRFNDARSRWGSCSSKGSIGLNINLMSLPPHLIDYVLLHELCHTRHLHHGADFWKSVEVVCPDFKSLRRELKHYQPGYQP